MWLNYSSVKATMATNHLYVIAAAINHRVLTVGRALCSKLLKWVNSRLVEHACMPCSVVSNSLRTPWTVAPPGSSVHGSFYQGCWSGLPFPTLGDLPDPGIKPTSPASASRFCTPAPPGNPRMLALILQMGKLRPLVLRGLSKITQLVSDRVRTWIPHMCVCTVHYICLCALRHFFPPTEAGYTLFLVLKLLFTS